MFIDKSVPILLKVDDWNFYFYNVSFMSVFCQIPTKTSPISTYVLLQMFL